MQLYSFLGLYLQIAAANAEWVWWTPLNEQDQEQKQQIGGIWGGAGAVPQQQQTQQVSGNGAGWWNWNLFGQQPGQGQQQNSWGWK